MGSPPDSTCGVGWVRAGLHFIVAPEVGGEVPLAGEQLAAQRALEVGEQEQVSLLATAHLHVTMLIFSTVVTSFGDTDPDVFGPPGSGSISQMYGSFLFLINMLSRLKKCLQNKILTQNFSKKI